MANPVIKVWLRTPRKAWRNDGGAIPRGFRTFVKKKYTGKRLTTVTTRSEVVRKGHWAVIAGGDIFSFSPAQMKRLYSRVPL
jgi:hypothetical protein